MEKRTEGRTDRGTKFTFYITAFRSKKGANENKRNRQKPNMYREMNRKKLLR